MAIARSLLVFLLSLLCCCRFVPSQASSIPAKYDGFAFAGAGPWKEKILIEAFLDPLCPDSRDSWPALKKAIERYSSYVYLIVHPFPLPYHNNAFLACRALYIANNLNSSSTLDLLELFFNYQERYYNAATVNLSRAEIQEDMSKLAVTVLGNSVFTDFQSGFDDSSTDSAARVSFKYGCTRGVYGAPFFFVNGFVLPDGGSPLSYSKWIEIIDPLVEKKKNSKNAGIYRGILDFYL